MKRPFRYSLYLLGIAFLASACGNSATILRQDGNQLTRLKGEIIRSTANELFVVEESGAITSIKRNHVYDIDHPGNGLMIFGGLLTSYGLLNIQVGLPQCDEEKRKYGSAVGTSFCVGVFAPAVLGGLLFIRGAITWFSSFHHARSPRPKKGSKRAVALMPSLDYPGVTLVGEF